MAILESDQPEGFLLFIKYFINNLKATREIYPSMCINYLNSLLWGEALAKSEFLSMKNEATMKVYLK